MAIGPSNTNPRYDAYKKVQELVDRFNSGELDYLPNKDKEQIAMQAAQFGVNNFKVGSKPVRKALFDLTDTALLGLLPNEWRPSSIGEEYFGESGLDSTFGTIGGVAGMAIPIGGALKAGKYAKSLWNKFAKRGNKVGNLGDIPWQKTIGYNGNNRIAQLNSSRDRLLLKGPAGYLPNMRTPSTPGMSDVVNIMNRGGSGYGF